MKTTHTRLKRVNRAAVLTFALLLFTATGICAPTDTSPPQMPMTGYRVGRHLLQSHTLGIVKAPISSAVELGSLAVRTGEAWVVRADIRFVKTHLLNPKPIAALADNGSMDLVAWEKWLDAHVALPETGGTVEFLVDGDAYFTRLQEAMAHARESITMQTYIFDNDDVAVEVADMLKSRSSEVDVRVLYDGLGTIMAQTESANSAPAGYRPPQSMDDYLTAASSVRVRRITNRWFTGDHSKGTIIDHQQAFMGGMNIGREYRSDWHDLMVELRGPVVKLLELQIEENWDRAGGGDLATIRSLFRNHGRSEAAGTGLRLLQTTPQRTEIADAQLEAIRRSRNRIYLENAYLADDQIVHELCKARKRGVDVRVIIPAENNHTLMRTSNLISMNRLIKNGVQVYHYPQMSHIKAAVFDGWACFGSANYDKLSLAVNRELNLGSSDPVVVNGLIERVFLPDMANSVLVSEQEDVSFVDQVIELLADEG